MTSDRLIKHFHEIAEAPDAIARLRRFILDLAVRGKLVEHDPETETAADLLARADIRKNRAEGRSLVPGNVEFIPSDDAPFVIPSNWTWVRLGDRLQMNNGRAFKPTDWLQTGLPIVRIQNLNSEDAPFNCCDESSVNPKYIIDTGSFLISWSGTPGTSFGAFIWRRGKAALNQHIFSCFQRSKVYYDEFLKIAINGRLDEMIARAHGGVGLQHITKGKLENLTLPLPPLAEQHRIVAKVDELMALCDELEAAQTKREHRRDRLVAATLHHLSNGNTATAAGQADSISAKRWPEFQQSAQQASTEHPKNATSSGFPPTHVPSSDESRPAHFFVNHLPRLTTKPNHIKQLRQTILNLAVQGRLVPQDPNEEPALELDNFPDESPSKPFAIPARWNWCRLNRIGLLSGGGTPSKSNESYWGGTIPWVSPKDMKSDRIGYSQLYITKDAVSKSAVRIISAGSLLFVVRGMILSHSFPVGVNEVPVTINQDMKAISPQILEWSDFLLVALKGLKYEILRKVQRSSHGTCRIESADYANLPVPIPPLAEQHRIVAKVNALTALCDELEASITTATTTRTALLESTLQAALHAGESR